jgi:DNA-binding transcriptional MerR regulator
MEKEGRVRKRSRYAREREGRSRPKTRAPVEGWLISELAALTGISVRTLRDYVTRGLIAPWEFRGTATRYGRLDLLRLVTLTRMRSQSKLTLNAAKAELDARDESELEANVNRDSLSPELSAALFSPASDLSAPSEPAPGVKPKRRGARARRARAHPGRIPPAPITLAVPESAASDAVARETLPSVVVARVLPELEALRPDQVIPLNVEVTSAVATVLGRLPQLNALRAELGKLLPDFDLVRFDKLEDYALTLLNVQADYLGEVHPEDNLTELVEQGVALRKALALDVATLVERGFLDARPLGELRGRVGYVNLASDLNLLSSLMSRHWTRIEGKTATQPNELERAKELGVRILRVVGLRAHRTQSIAAAAELRDRAFTLLIEAYNAARRALKLLRWKQGDADDIAPSLHAARSPRRAARERASVPATSDDATDSTACS